MFVPVPDHKSVPNRVHLDLASPSTEAQATLVDRLLGLGATPADVGQGQVPWVVLADPEGNELCVLEPRDQYRGTGPLAAVVMAAADPPALARFWAEAAAWPVTVADERFAGLRDPSGTGPFLELIRSSAPKVVKNRLHLDLAPYRGEDPAAEVARLLALGATRATSARGGHLDGPGRPGGQRAVRPVPSLTTRWPRRPPTAPGSGRAGRADQHRLGRSR